MTTGILKYDGVIADFQGDAALGFWGWPTSGDEGPLAACRAAAHIQQAFYQARSDPRSPLRDFQVGIGIATGQAIAGQIGTLEQSKVGAFGPVVNQGARLESLTKQLGAAILIDDATAAVVRARAGGELRCRRLGRVQPYGMSLPVAIAELIAPWQDSANFTTEAIQQFEAAVDAVAAGDWREAAALLTALPSDDRGRAFLLDHLVAQGLQPPEDWDGVLRLSQK